MSKSKATVLSEATLRRMAYKLGYALVRPWGGDSRGIGDLDACYVLVPLNSGLTIEQVQVFLERMSDCGQLGGLPSIVH